MKVEDAWRTKNATLSDKSAKEDYGLTQEEIIFEIKANRFHYRINYVYDNPY